LEEIFLSASDSGNPPDKKSHFSIRNVRLFIAFRICFNARFYYPVFAILFLDFGLTLDQFALLNAAWAATIVLMEVPSGALADTIGRRKLLIVAGILMVIEMALLCFVPLGNVSLLFGVFIVNRFLSGIAEAAASGADEAIAYDSLKQEGNAGDWPRVIETQMRMQSMAYIGAMSLGQPSTTRS
jgi:MFS family permease